MLVFPELTISRSWPENICHEDRPIYQPSLEGISLACNIHVMENVCVNRELLIFKGNNISNESFAWPTQIERYRPWEKKAKFLIKNTLLRKKIKLETTALWCLNNYSTGGFYHWLSEVLPRLWVVKAYLPDAVVPIPDYFLERWPFVQETLAAFGNVQIRSISDRQVLQFKTLVLPTQTGGSSNYQPIPIQQVALTLVNHFYDPGFTLNTDKIYISRKHAKHRKVINEEDLLPILEKNGFRVSYFETLGFKEQINICARAKYVVGVHGAGLTNLMFLPAKSKIMEIRTPAPLPWLNCFYTLANVFQIGYSYFLGKPIEELLPLEDRPDDKSLWVDPTEFEKQLMQFLTE